MANAQQLATVIRGPYPGRMIAARRRDPSPVRAEGHIPDHAQHRSAGMGHAQMLAAISAIEDAGNVAAGRAEPAPLWAEGDAGDLAATAPGELLPGSRGPDGFPRDLRVSRPGKVHPQLMAGYPGVRDERLADLAGAVYRGEPCFRPRSRDQGPQCPTTLSSSSMSAAFTPYKRGGDGAAV